MKKFLIQMERKETFSGTIEAESEEAAREEAERLWDDDPEKWQDLFNYGGEDYISYEPMPDIVSVTEKKS
jgi:hypothetical protein